MLDLSLWSGIFIYSMIGSALILLLSWRRFVMLERQDDHVQWGDATAHGGYASVAVHQRRVQ